MNWICLCVIIFLYRPSFARAKLKAQANDSNFCQKRKRKHRNAHSSKLSSNGTNIIKNQVNILKLKANQLNNGMTRKSNSLQMTKNIVDNASPDTDEDDSPSPGLSPITEMVDRVVFNEDELIEI